MLRFIVFTLLCTHPLLAAEFNDFRSGDLIFHTSSSKQSYAIMWASKSLYSHVGIVETREGKSYVLEAISKVSRTPLTKWINRGRLGRFALYRMEHLTPEQVEKTLDGAKRLLGTSYDPYFTSKNKEIYCSELAALAFRNAGIELGKWQKQSELDVDNPLVRKLAKTRWEKHPLCKKLKSFESCWKSLQDDELLTPESLSQDPKLKLIYSSYP